MDRSIYEKIDLKIPYGYQMVIENKFCFRKDEQLTIIDLDEPEKFK